MRRFRFALPFCFVFVIAMLTLVSPPAGAEDLDDPYLWLEDVEGDAALSWVREQNEKTLAHFQGSERYRTLYDRLLAILTSDERISYPQIAGDYVYNVWTDQSHPRGLWRRAPLASYVAGEPAWEDLLDVTALAEAEGVNWTFHGVTCHSPGYERCLVYLSRGGSDTTEIREFDVPSRSFVSDGFFLPEAKTGLTWVNEDTILVATDWGEGTLTTSGYPAVVKRVERGRPLAEAVTVFQSALTDMGAGVLTISLGDEDIPVIVQAVDFFHQSTYLLRDDELVLLDIPSDAAWLVVADQLVILPRSDWHVGGTVHRPGSVLAVDFEAFLEGDRAFTTLFVPSERTIVHAMDATADDLLLSVLNNVSSELYRFRYDRGTGDGQPGGGAGSSTGGEGSSTGGEGTSSIGKGSSSNEGSRESTVGGWGMAERVPIPELGGADIVSTSGEDNRAFIAFSSYLQPSTLYLLDNDGAIRPVAQAPELFEGEGLVVEQYEAVSRDGTAVPYFVVRRGDLVFDGSNPTVVYGYGGFEEALTPEYSPVPGAAWLEGHGGRGDVYVVANIRGGGEFGPQWHRAALRENRQRAYDDFIAVAEDLIARGITSPEHMGILGGSNGGLLTGVALTQRPDLYGAVVSAVPLLDMRRYHRLLAGASWMAEYGNPDDPEDWAFISRYSPYHNVRPDRTYPPVLFTTSTRDDRVHPGHARKMAARMLSMGHSVYYYESTEGGHGGAVTPEQEAEMWALVYSFFGEHLHPRR